MQTNSPYESVVEIVADYLGPAGKRFIDRQIKFHLDKSPKDLSLADMPQLVEWVKVSLSLLTDDKSMVDECLYRLSTLS